MKKIYIKPDTDIVNVHLMGSVMQDGQGGFGPYSNVAGGGDNPGFGDAKENNLLWDNDLWADDSDNADSYDIWKE